MAESILICRHNKNGTGYCECLGEYCVEGPCTAEELIEYAPVRHGRWDDSGRYKFPNGETAVCCTECGCALRKKEYENNNWFYCPVCGAIMDKEE